MWSGREHGRDLPLPGEVLLRGVAEASFAVSVADACAEDLPLVYVNAAFEQVSGYPAEQVLGRNCRVLQGPHRGPDARHGLDEVRDALREQRPARVRLLQRRPNGEDWWNELHLSYVRSAAGDVTHVLGLQHDVTEQVHGQRHLEALAYRDPLTGLPNRRQLEVHVALALARAERAGTAVALLYLDLDGFKAVNDTLGHSVGDLLLCRLAQRLRGAVRGTDLVARHGGDEFVVLLADLPRTGAGAATDAAADQIRAALARGFDLPGVSLGLTASIGVALYPMHARTQHELLRLADRGMYRAKPADAVASA